MNFFFGIKSKEYKNELFIPKFKNNSKIDKDINLFQAKIENKKWVIENVSNFEKENFYVLNNSNLDNHNIFFLAKNSEIFYKKNFKKKFYINELANFSSYTDTDPDYRSNLRIYNQSVLASYQSDYPFKMIKSEGSILSPIYPLTNKEAEINKIFLRNIYFLPMIKTFYAYLIDYKKKKIIQTFEITTNTTNEIILKNDQIYEDVYLFTKGFIGIPVFVSQKENSLSMEHTHPPHHYLLGHDKFRKINNLKETFNEIINKENI